MLLLEVAGQKCTKNEIQDNLYKLVKQRFLKPKEKIGGNTNFIYLLVSKLRNKSLVIKISGDYRQYKETNRGMTNILKLLYMFLREVLSHI